MQLTVENVTPAKTGKSLRIKANGDWYGAKKDSGISSGMTIEADVEDGDFGKWIQKWRPIQAASTPTTAPAASRPAAAPAGNGAAPWWMPFVSNVTAHAIQAGYVQTPAQIEAWAWAARLAAQKLETDIPA